MKSILFNISSYTGALLALLILCSSQSAWAERCEPQENNEYEKIFCQLKRSGRGAGLPNIYQFRENPPITQALLLKKSAERAGIAIVIPERDNQGTQQRQEALLTAGPAAATDGPRPLDRAVKTISVIQQAPPVPVPAETQPSETMPSTKIRTVTPLQPQKATAAVTAKDKTNENIKEQKVIVHEVVDTKLEAAMEGCSLQQLTLQCANGRYQLVGNKTNQQLSANALSDENKLNLPAYNGPADDAAALEQYLTGAYSRYLAGMIDIGLGASTMSYGKFAKLYKYITDQHLDFPGRFETMYQFLKKDKQTIGVSTKLTLAEGLPLQTCSVVDNFIACDYQKSNYVFVKDNSSEIK